MASSGTANGNSVSYGNYYYVSWSLSSQSVSNNTSTISWNAYWRFNGSDAQLDNGNVVINGSSRWDNGGRVYNFAGNYSTRSLKVASGSYTMSHSSNGTKTFSITGSLTQYSGETSSINKSYTLPTIPRNATFDSYETNGWSEDDDFNANIDNPANGYIRIRMGITYVDSSTVWLTRNLGKADGNITITPTSGELNTLYSNHENDGSFSVNVEMRTYSDSGYSNQIGSEVNVNSAFNIINANPDFSTFTYRDSNSVTSAITGDDQYLIQGKSTLEATILSANKATALKYATMDKYNFSISSISSDQAYSTGDIVKDLGVVNTNTSSNLVVKAIDSRNYQTSVSQLVNILPYIAPQNTVVASRLNDFETQTTIHIESVISRLTISSVDKNAVNSGSGVKYRYKKTTDATWSSWVNKSSTTTTGNVAVTDFDINLDRNYAWDFEVTVTDKLETTTTAIVVPKGIPIFFIGDNGQVSINKLPENGDLDVEGEIYAEGGQKVIVGDTGWIDATLTSDFNTYSSGEEVRYRKQGAVVTLNGAVKPSSNSNNVGTTGGDTIMVLPEGFRPARELRIVCHGSDRAKWLMRIGSNGSVIACRYTSNATAYVTPTTGNWLPFQATFMCEEV